MSEIILCKICGKRRAKRACPAVQADICPLCCGSERENTLACPLECEYLEEAHHREKAVEVPQEDFVNPEIEITEEFLTAQEELLLFCVYALVQGALRTPGAVDDDVIAALAALVQTQRTLDSGLLYETHPDNLVAAAVQRAFSASLNDYRKLREEREPLSPVRNSDILKTLVFLQRMGLHNRNGRPKGRMFIDLLRHMTPDTPIDEPAPSLII